MSFELLRKEVFGDTAYIVHIGGSYEDADVAFGQRLKVRQALLQGKTLFIQVVARPPELERDLPRGQLSSGHDRRASVFALGGGIGLALL